MKNKKSRKALLSAGIFFGLAAVASVTFAAYVITGDAEDKDFDLDPGTITVEDRTVNVVAAWNDNTLSFGPSDKEGKITYSGETSEEDLVASMDITVTWGNSANWDYLTIKATPSKDDKGGVDDAVSAGYITLPGTDGLTTIEKDQFTSGTLKNVTLEFGWGAKFGGPEAGKNPSIYLEDHLDTAVDTLNAFKASLENTTIKFVVSVHTSA